jgi:hypothetical protein
MSLSPDAEVPIDEYLIKYFIIECFISTYICFGLLVNQHIIPTPLLTAHSFVTNCFPVVSASIIAIVVLGSIASPH